LYEETQILIVGGENLDGGNDDADRCNGGILEAIE
jgi:Fe-S-cluster formation regulator IscX/YfhJ